MAGRSSASSAWTSSTRIAHCGLPTWTCWKRQLRPSGGQLSRCRHRRRLGNRRSRSRARPHARGVQLVGDVIVGRISPAAVWIENVSLSVQPAPAQVQDRLARAVARQLGLGAVGVEDPQPGDEAGLVGLGEQQDPVGEHARVRRRRARAPAPAVSSNGELRAARRSDSRCRAPATSRSPRGGSLVCTVARRPCLGACATRPRRR